MKFKTGLFIVIVVSGLAGCAQLVTDRVLDRQCDKSHVDCPGRETVERKAGQADMAAFRAMGDHLNRERDEPNPAPPYHDSSELLCPEGQKKVCSANAGCRCESD